MYTHRAGNFHILIITNDSKTVRSVVNGARSYSTQVTLVRRLSAAEEMLSQNQKVKVVILDTALAESNAFIERLKERNNGALFILVTNDASLDMAVKSLAQGAFDYICKTENLELLSQDLSHSLERAQKYLESDGRKNHDNAESTSESRSIVGRSSAMVKLYRTIAKAALSRGNVVISGESGTGKELVAHAIHENSPRSGKPFVTVNCGALVESLLESELFGHIKGSFTGAISSKRGLFEEAHEGTIFLDEIGEISQGLQVKLLRTIQEGEIKPVGSCETRKVDVRVIVATHQDLESLMRAGKFREDLYYRLKVFLIEIPSLRERKEDIPELVRHFIHRVSKKTGIQIESVSLEAMSLLLEYPWPGNIRELENAIEHAASMASGNILLPDDFPAEILNTFKQPAPAVAAPISVNAIAENGNGRAAHVSTFPPIHAARSLVEVESIHISKTLELANFNKSRAAKILGIDRRTLYRKAKLYNISLNNT